jgi:hypothetical protein
MKQLVFNYSGELIVDSFAGGGGTSTGIRWATGRGPDIAINHDSAAIAMHAAKQSIIVNRFGMSIPGKLPGECR